MAASNDADRWIRCYKDMFMRNEKHMIARKIVETTTDGVHHSNPGVNTEVDRLRVKKAAEDQHAMACEKRDVASWRMSNVESRMYPGLICGDPMSLVLADRCIRKARAGRWESIEFHGDIVSLPDDLCETLPCLKKITCHSENLLGFPAGLEHAINKHFPEYGKAVRASYIMKTNPHATRLNDRIDTLESVVKLLEAEIAELKSDRFARLRGDTN